MNEELERTLFLHLLILASDDGIVDMTHEAIASRIYMPIDLVREGIKVLEAEDQRSLFPKLGNPRIVRLDDRRDWGWRIINFDNFRAISSRSSETIDVAPKRTPRFFYRSPGTTEEWCYVGTVDDAKRAIADMLAADLPEIEEGEANALLVEIQRIDMTDAEVAVMPDL